MIDVHDRWERRGGRGSAHIMKPLAYTKTQTLKPGSIFVKYVARLPLVTDASGKSPNSPQVKHSKPTANPQRMDLSTETWID